MNARSTALLGALLLGCSAPQSPPQVPVQQIPAGVAHYQLPGALLPVEEPLPGFAIMRRQVSQAEYAACVDAGACLALEGGWRDARDPQLPAVGLSWQDATAYAAWLSERSGARYRLPRYGEWVLAAGSAHVEEQPIVDVPGNPAQRWLAEYAREAEREPLSAQLRPFAEQGQSSTGLQGIAQNVWEWTDSCFGQPAAAFADFSFCGVRLAAGRHVSALSDFVRDPISGACSVGVPPTHLGLRLVRED